MKSALANSDPDAILAGLNDEQRAAATRLHGPVCILAGAGTGKTRTIAHRVAYGVAVGEYRPDGVMALSFTTRAADELGRRLSALGAEGVRPRTIHSAALAQLNHFWPRLVGGTAPRVIDSKLPLVVQARDELGIRLSNSALPNLTSAIEWSKSMLISDERITDALSARLQGTGLAAPRFFELVKRYEQVKTQARAIDFEDVLLVTAGMIADEPAVAAEVRSRYRVLVVDEYQDVSPLQHELLRQWLGPRRELCVVGDASQAIYGFTGGSASFLTGFSTEYADARVFELDQNYRSHADVLAVANSLMSGRSDSLRLRVAVPVGTVEAPSTPLAPPASPDNAAVHPPVNPSTPTPTPHVRLRSFATDAAEVAGIAHDIELRWRSEDMSQAMAVLCRTQAQTVRFCDELLGLGIPAVTGEARGVFERGEMSAIIMALHAASKGASKTPVDPIFDEICSGFGWMPDPPPVGEPSWQRWATIRHARALRASLPPNARISELHDLLVNERDSGAPPLLGEVVVTTIHAAKGREWAHVWVPALVEGNLPTVQAPSGDSVAEEHRLLYVAVTRARDTLTLSWHRLGVGGVVRPRSRFVNMLGIRIPDELGATE